MITFLRISKLWYNEFLYNIIYILCLKDSLCFFSEVSFFLLYIYFNICVPFSASHFCFLFFFFFFTFPFTTRLAQAFLDRICNKYNVLNFLGLPGLRLRGNLSLCNNTKKEEVEDYIKKRIFGCLMLLNRLYILSSFISTALVELFRNEFKAYLKVLFFYKPTFSYTTTKKMRILFNNLEKK